MMSLNKHDLQPVRPLDLTVEEGATGVEPKALEDSGGSVSGAQTAQRPTIVCLCGSTRFYREFQRANYEETMAGRIVLSVGFYMHSAEAAHGETWGCTAEQKIALDNLHKRKIELADEVLILNVGGYIGPSTRSELAHAQQLRKRIRYLEPSAVSAPETDPPNPLGLETLPEANRPQESGPESAPGNQAFSFKSNGDCL